MKLQFRCKNHASYLNFSSTLMKLSENFRLLYIEIVFDAIILRRFFSLMKLLQFFFTVSFFFLQFHFFVKLFYSFIIFFHFFLRKNTSFWPVFVAQWGFNERGKMINTVLHFSFVNFQRIVDANLALIKSSGSIFPNIQGSYKFAKP